jgi:hypothetical protein
MPVSSATMGEQHRWPRHSSLDASLDKSFAIGEKTRIQFRTEAFNPTNRVNLVPPVFDMNSPAFGQITGAQAPRHSVRFEDSTVNSLKSPRELLS